MPAQTIGQTAYDAYFLSSGGRSLVSGQTLPAWDDLSEAIQGAWESSAQAVLDRFPVALVESDSVRVPELCDAIRDAVAVAEWAFGLAGHVLNAEQRKVRESVLMGSLKVAQMQEDESRRVRVRLFPSEQDAFEAFAFILCDLQQAHELPSGDFELYEDEFVGSAEQLFHHYAGGGFWVGSVGTC